MLLKLEISFFSASLVVSAICLNSASDPLKADARIAPDFETSSISFVSIKVAKASIDVLSTNSLIKSSLMSVF